MRELSELGQLKGQLRNKKCFMQQALVAKNLSAPVHKVRLLYEEGYWVTLEQWAVGVSRAKLCSLAMMLDGLHSETRPWLSSLCAVAGR